jgi:hypothetical protein
MRELIRKYPQLEEKLFDAYDILSNSGYEIIIEDGQMVVYHKVGCIELDLDEGLVIVDDDYRDEYEERQEEIDEEYFSQ